MTPRSTPRISHDESTLNMATATPKTHMTATESEKNEIRFHNQRMGQQSYGPRQNPPASGHMDSGSQCVDSIHVTTRKPTRQEQNKYVDDELMTGGTCSCITIINIIRHLGKSPMPSSRSRCGAVPRGFRTKLVVRVSNHRH